MTGQIKRIFAILLAAIIMVGFLLIAGCERHSPVEAAQLQPTLNSIQTNIFSQSCAVTGCHLGSSAPLGLDLSEGNSYGNLVNVASDQMPALLRIEPNDPDNSYLIRKLEGGPNISGGRMPLGRTALSQQQINMIRQWIADGAPGGGMNASPVVSNIPDQTIFLGDTFQIIELDDFVDDPDHADSSITWSFSYMGNGHLSVSIDDNRMAKINILDTTWTGNVKITFTATDPDGFSDRDMASYTVSTPNLSTFSQIQIQIFTPTCAVAGCHSGSMPAAGMNLSQGQAHSNLVNVPSTTDPGVLRVNPGSSDQSMLVKRLSGEITPQMPLGGTPLSAAMIDSVAKWINDGATQN